MHTFEFDAIGTRWRIDIDSSDTPNLGRIESAIQKRIEAFDKAYSRFRSDSFVRLLSAKKGKFILPSDAPPLFALYHDLYKLTRGRFTPLIGQTLVDAGYDETYSLKPKPLHHPRSWEEVIVLKARSITMKYKALLDFGAAGKGYLIDIVGDLLEENGVTSYCIDAGGDIRYRNDTNKHLRVGLENPDNFEQVIGIALVGNESICASAGNRRRWKQFHHIIDPFTLQSPQSIKAVWVIAGTTILADALSTCLFFVSPEVLLKRYKFEYVILYHDFSVRKSEGFRGELFLKVD